MRDCIRKHVEIESRVSRATFCGIFGLHAQVLFAGTFSRFRRSKRGYICENVWLSQRDWIVVPTMNI